MCMKKKKKGTLARLLSSGDNFKPFTHIVRLWPFEFSKTYSLLLHPTADKTCQAMMQTKKQEKEILFFGGLHTSFEEIIFWELWHTQYEDFGRAIVKLLAPLSNTESVSIVCIFVFEKLRNEIFVGWCQGQKGGDNWTQETRDKLSFIFFSLLRFRCGSFDFQPGLSDPSSTQHLGSTSSRISTENWESFKVFCVYSLLLLLLLFFSGQLIVTRQPNAVRLEFLQQDHRILYSPGWYRNDLVG